MKIEERTESHNRLEIIIKMVISISHLNFRYGNYFKMVSNKRLNQCVIRSYKSEGYKL